MDYWQIVFEQSMLQLDIFYRMLGDVSNKTKWLALGPIQSYIESAILTAHAHAWRNERLSKSQ